MAERQYGPQILREAQAMYLVMLADKTNYGQRALVDLVELHLPSLANTPLFRAEVIALLGQQTGWGRRVFINQLFDLIAGYFGIYAPRDPAPVSQWVAAPAPAPAVLAVMDYDDLNFDDLTITPLPGSPDSPPWN